MASENDAASGSRSGKRGQPMADRYNGHARNIHGALDTAIANVSLPYIAGGLATSYDESTWVLTSYLVANAVVLPLSAWLSRVNLATNCVRYFVQ